MNIILALVIALFCATNLTATPAQVLIIRHAEKPDKGHNLSQEGYERAEALVDYFKKNPRVTRFGTPVAIYAAAPGHGHHSVRSIETVTPLANALGQEVDDVFIQDEYKEVAKEILSLPEYEGKMVLLCWRHSLIPGLAKEFGVKPVPEKWPKHSFSQVWEIDFKNDEVDEFKFYEQELEKALSK